MYVLNRRFSVCFELPLSLSNHVFNRSKVVLLDVVFPEFLSYEFVKVRSIGLKKPVVRKVVRTIVVYHARLLSDPLPLVFPVLP